MRFDVVIVGAGPAGLSAALWLGRCARRTLVLDSGQPRNAASRALHGFLTRDGTAPGKLRQLARANLAQYPSVRLRAAVVRQIRRRRDRFVITTTAGARFEASFVLLATGRVDAVPTAPGFSEFYGRGIFHCPYCDGWEHRGQAIAVYGDDADAGELAKLLATWSKNLAILTDGRKPSPALRHCGFPIIEAPIAKLVPDAKGELASVKFADKSQRTCRAIFFSSNCAQKSDLPRRLGCRFDRDGAVMCKRHAAVGVPGLFVAGNVRNGVHLAITAAAEGAEAALAINELLLGRQRPTPCR